MDTERLCGRGSALYGQAGFSLAEFMMATLVLLVLSGAIFGMLAQTQRAASYQTEVQAVLDNTRIAVETVEHIIRQAGNNPLGVTLTGVTYISDGAVRIQSDLTGSVSADKGDPDGDIADSGEDLTISFDEGARTIDVAAGTGSAQPIASYIGGFTLQLRDATGSVTTDGDAARMIRVAITGSSLIPDPQTGDTFSIELQSDIQIANRQ